MRKQNVQTDSSEDPYTTFTNNCESESRLAVIIAVVSFVILMAFFLT